MGCANSKHRAPPTSPRPREIILGHEKIPRRSRRQSESRSRQVHDHGVSIESREVPREVPRDIPAATRPKTSTGSIRPKTRPGNDLVPRRTTSVGCTQLSWSHGRVPQLEKLCYLQQKRLIDRRSEIRQLRGQVESLEGKRSELESKNVELAGLTQELKSKNEELAELTQQLESRNGELAEATQELESKAAKLTSEITELESQAAKLEGRKDEIEAEFLAANVDERTLLDDGAVKDRWAGLEYTILNIVIERFSRPPDDGHEEPEEEVFADFVAEPRAWLRSGRREWLFQAFIWNALVERIFGEYGFSAHGYNLSGENRRVYSSYLQALRDECSKPGGITRLQYQKLKAAMNMILSPTKKPDTHRIAKVAAEIENELLPFQSPNADPDDCPSFEELVRDAVGLDADMAKCRAWYQVSMYDFKQAGGESTTGDNEPLQVEAFGMAFSGKTMQDVLDGKGQKVSLVVSPMLVKWGDLDGKNFGNGMALARKGVITE